LKGEVVAEYKNPDINDTIRKSSIKTYLTSISDIQDSGTQAGLFMIGISTIDSDRIVISRLGLLGSMTLLLIIILSIAAGFVLNGMIGRPISHLVSFADKISMGQLDATVPLNSNDELGLLSRTMIRMRDKLKKSHDSLLNQNDLLEEMVEERTRSLSRAHKEIEEAYDSILTSQQQMIFLAHHDPLTNLSNRRGIFDKLNVAINNPMQDNILLAILYIDLDNLKQINDKYGHTVGDAVILEAAIRISKHITERDKLGRIGSDEFVAYLYIESTEEGEKRAQEIITEMQEPCLVDSNFFYVTCSIGITLYPEHGTETETLLNKSDIALHQAKASGKNCWLFFNADLYNREQYRSELLQEMHDALKNSEFQLYYQPKIDMNSTIVGLEALIRWISPKRGIISPIDFIPVAEESGLIVKIGQWVIETTCNFINTVKKECCQDIIVSCNVSPRQLWNSDLLSNIVDAIEETGADPSLLELEITESAAIEDIDRCIKLVSSIKVNGIQISIDDFGTGFSSFSKLTKFPFDVLKIDKSFIDRIEENDSSKITVKSIIDLAHNLAKLVIAEGVETEQQFNMLEQLGCDQIQGYYYSKPLPEDQVINLIREQCEC
jgi:diguanylate cyclase (GGDEF)-like protein